MEAQVLVVLGAIVFVCWLLLDFSRNKLSRCPRCKGKGHLPSTFFPTRYRPCPRCNRAGEIGGG